MLDLNHTGINLQIGQVFYLYYYNLTFTLQK